MAKKSFTGGLNSLLGESPAQSEEVVKEQLAEKSVEFKPTSEVLKSITKEVTKQPKKEVQNSSKAGTKKNETRAPPSEGGREGSSARWDRSGNKGNAKPQTKRFGRTR